MGQNSSKGDFLVLLACMLKDKGIAMSENLLSQLLQIIKEYNPWFSDKSTLDVECWERDLNLHFLE